MPTNTPDQQITYPADADAADNPVAFNQFVGDVEPRLVREYTTEADRTARMLALTTNEISSLSAPSVGTPRVEVYDGTNHVSLYTRSLYGFVRLNATFPLTASSTVLQNVTGIAIALPAVASQIFRFRGVLFYDGAATGDIKFAFTVPAGVTMRWGAIGLAAAAATNPGDGTFASTPTSGTALGFGCAGAGTILMATVEGELTTSATAGNLQLQAAQNTSDVTVSNVIARSSLEAWRVS